jgi:hypothetical protein
MEKPDSFWDYASLFEKYKKDCTIFFETGTHQGDSVADALYLGYEKIFSVEVAEVYYNMCVEKFKNNDNVYLFLGDSNIRMPEMLTMVDQKALFWLDGHWLAGHENTGEPIWKELEFLESQPIKTHTILIDDIDPLFPGRETDLKQAILKINPAYKFVMEPQVKSFKSNQGAGIQNGHLVAYIE